MIINKKIHPKSRSPFRSPPTYGSPSRTTTLRSEVEQPSPKSPSESQRIPSSEYNLEYPEVQTLIEKLEKISISAEKPAKSQSFEGSVSSVLQPRRIWTHSQSKKIGIPPFEFPIAYFRKKTKKFESQTSASEVLSHSPPQTPSFPPLIPTTSIPTIGVSSSSPNTQSTSYSTQTLLKPILSSHPLKI